MKTIVYLIEQPLGERNFDRFGIQSWIDRNWKVAVWDFTPWAHPRVWTNFIEAEYEFKQFSGYFPITSKSQLAQRCAELGKVGYFIDLTGDNNCTIRAKLRLVRNGATRVVCAVGSMPEPDSRQNRGLFSILGSVLSAGPIKAIERVTGAIIRKLAAPFIRPGLVVVAGEKSIPPADFAHAVLKAHNFDYDIYLGLKQSRDNPEEEYAIFIDQDYCFHSDFIYQEVPFFVSPGKYFPAVRNALNRIADALNVKVRVAAHPRASYGQRGGDYFKGFPIEYGRTAELIRGCRVVICHDSTAIQFAVLFGKPAIFVTTDEIAPFYEGKSIAKVASEFGKSAINLDRDLDGVDWEEELYVDSVKYANYRNNYIKIEGSPEIPLWHIVIDHIEKTEARALTDMRQECSPAKMGG